MKKPTDRAMVQRINIRLRKSGRSLRTARVNTYAFHELGRHYVVSASGNIEQTHVDLITFLRTQK